MNQEDALQVGLFPDEILEHVAELIAGTRYDSQINGFFAAAGYPELAYKSLPGIYPFEATEEGDDPDPVIVEAQYRWRHSSVLGFLRDLNCRADAPRDVIAVIEKLADPKQYLTRSLYIPQFDGPEAHRQVIESLNTSLIFHGLKVDERNRVVPSGAPPPATPLLAPSERSDVELLERLAIHPKIRQVSEKLFADGHYAQAIFEALKAIEIAVKEKSGLRDLFGKSLMSTAFSLKAPRLRSNALETTTEQNEQEGFMFLFMGAMAALRNPGGHEIGAEPDVHYTLWCLGLASLLMTKVDEAVRADSEPDRACG